MNDEQLDQALSKEVEISPSSGFVSSVMDSLRRDAAAPPPLAFPWTRAIPGIVVCGGILVWLLIQAVRLPSRATASPSVLPNLPSLVAPWRSALETSGAAWILLAIAVTLAGVRLSKRLAGR